MKMNYPTIEEVQKADRTTLARWYRFLPSPGWCAIREDNEVFERVMEKEQEIQKLIVKRFDEMGGFTSEISKHIGWKLL